jgi:hypothetical protein
MAENYKNGNSKKYENILKEIYLNISITLIAQINLICSFFFISNF